MFDKNLKTYILNLDLVTVKQIPSPLVEVEEQTKLLHSHLVKTGTVVKTGQIKGKLVFTNPELKIPEEIEANGLVMMKNDIPKFCRGLQKTWTEYITAPLIPSLISGALSYNQISASSSGLRKAGTWDKLMLNGGRTLDGDYKVNNYKA
jgi:hypothetical protein